MSGKPSVRAVTVAAMFGLLTPGGGMRGSPAVRAAGRLAAQLDAALHPGEIALVRGASGSGKSVVLRALGERARSVVRLQVLGGPPVYREGRLTWPRYAAVDLVDLPLSGALRLLARAGLADARALVRPVQELSKGEQWRLRLALAMRDCEQAVGEASTPLLIIDEFCSVLDRASARAVAHTLARWVRASGRVRVVCATAHDDLGAALAPDLVVSCGLGRPGRMERVRVPAAA